MLEGQVKPAEHLYIFFRAFFVQSTVVVILTNEMSHTITQCGRLTMGKCLRRLGSGRKSGSFPGARCCCCCCFYFILFYVFMYLFILMHDYEKYLDI